MPGILWTEENQYSVVPVSDIMGENVKEGDEAIVAWRAIGKNRKISTSWYKAKILIYSGEFNSFNYLISKQHLFAIKRPLKNKIFGASCRWQGIL